jgi:hypothetical protein
MTGQSTTCQEYIDNLVVVPRDGTRMILLRRHATLLASGGTIDLERGVIKGGDPTNTTLPDGTLPLSPKEINMIRRRW